MKDSTTRNMRLRRLLNSSFPFSMGLVCFALSTLSLVSIAQAQTEYAFVVTTDFYSAAYYSTIEVVPPRTTHINIGTVSTDPVVHYDPGEGMVFVINRYLADNIQVIDPQADFTTIAQYSVGNGSNPHDIRLASSTKAYVSRFEWKTLLIVNPHSGDSLGVIDLSVFADSDGIPEMDRMEIVSDRLFVTLNCIDHSTWLPNGPGKVAVIDIQADTLVDCDPGLPGIQPIVLDLPNPYSELRYEPCSGKLIVGCLGAWGDLLGGVASIDPCQLTSVTLVSEADLGGDISDALLTPQGKGYAVLLDTLPWPDNYARLVSFDPAAGNVIDTLYVQTSGTGSSLASIEANRQGEIYLCDRNLTQPGMRIYDASTDTIITKIDVGLPPFDLEFVQIPWAGVERISPQLSRLIIMPNPTSTQAVVVRNQARLEEGCAAWGKSAGSGSAKSPGLWSAKPHEAVEAMIYNVEGRLVQRLTGREVGEETIFRWNLEDELGRRVSPGIYYCRVRAGDNEPAGTIVVTR